MPLVHKTTASGLDARGTAATLCTVVFWSFGPIAIKLLTHHVDSWTQNLLRYLAAVAMWAPLILI